MQKQINIRTAGQQVILDSSAHAVIHVIKACIVY